MPDKKKKKAKGVVVGESNRQVDGSGVAPDVGVPLIDQFPPDLPIVREAVVSGEAKRRLEVEGTEADDEPKIISVGWPLSIIVAWESEGFTFEVTVGRTGLFSETETALGTAGLLIC